MRRNCNGIYSVLEQIRKRLSRETTYTEGVSEVPEGEDPSFEANQVASGYSLALGFWRSEESWTMSGCTENLPGHINRKKSASIHIYIEEMQKLPAFLGISMSLGWKNR